MVYDQLHVFEAKEKMFPLSTLYVCMFTVSPPLVKIRSEECVPKYIIITNIAIIIK